MKQSLISLVVALVLIGCAAENAPPVEPAAAENAPLSGKSDSPFAFDGTVDWAVIAQRCGEVPADEPILYQSDFQWDYSHEAMASRFDEIYVSGKRLQDRAYREEASGDYVLPVSENWGGRTILSKRLVENLRLHIEKALARGYAEFIFFPDMGHTHLFIPRDHWDAEYANGPAAEIGNMYSRLFDDPELKVLFHTAEQLQQRDDDGNLLPDRHLQWRFFTRNLVGDNNWGGRVDILHDPESAANTVRSMADHKYYGGGFNISASKEGCFPFNHNGETLYFDISMSDLPSDTSPDAAGDYF